MTLKGTPNIADRSFRFDTDNRDETLVRLKPLGSNGAAVGSEVMYTCKSSGDPTHEAGDDETETTIGTIPHTGPKETFAIVLVATLILYFVYRKLRAR